MFDIFETSECFLVQKIHSKTEQNDFSLSSVSGQVAVAIRFLTRDPSLIWNTGSTRQ